MRPRHHRRFHALQEMGLVVEGGTYINETLSGTLEGVVVGKDAILMDMAKPQTFQRLETPEELEELYRIMGLSADGQGAVTGKPELMLLPQKVSTGLTDIMMPVADEAELEKIAPDFPALTEHSRRYNVVGVHAFTVNTADGMIHARNFAPLYDIDEEAATGTSNGALVYYLYRHGLVELDKVYTVVQGEKMGRPSMISRSGHPEGRPALRQGGRPGRDVGPGARSSCKRRSYAIKKAQAGLNYTPFVGQYGILLRLAVPDEGLPAGAERKKPLHKVCLVKATCLDHAVAEHFFWAA